MTLTKSFKNALLSSLLMILTLSFSSCIKDYLGIKEIHLEDDWDASFAVPIAHARFSTLDIFDKVNMGKYSEVDDDYFVTLVYKGRPFYGHINQYLSLSNLNIQLGPYQYDMGGQDSVRVLTNIYFSENTDHELYFTTGEEISKMTLKKGKMSFYLRSDLRRSGQLEVTIPDAKKNNIPFMKIIPINYTGSKPVIITDTFDLSGYTFDLTKNGTTYNKIPAVYTITLNANTNYIQRNDRVQVNLGLQQMDYAYIEGYFGNQNINYSPDSIELNIFNSSTSGIVSFVNPKIAIDIKNSIGLPIRVQPPYFESVSDKYGNIRLSGPLVANAKDLNYPLISEVGQSKSSYYMADGYNSNVRDLVNSMPKFVSYDIDLESNQAGKTHTNFATDSSHIAMDVVLEIPLHAKSKEWETSMEMDFGGFNVDSIEQIKQIKLNLIVTNELPLEVRGQVYFYDTLGAVVDSMFSSRRHFIQAANQDAYGKLIAPKTVLSEIIADNQKIQNIGNARKLSIHVWVSSTGGGDRDVKVFADKYLDIKLGLKVDLIQKLNELMK